MQRFGDVIRVPAEKYAEYVEKHDNIWPSIVEMMRQANIVNFTIFHFFRKNEKMPETLDFTGFSGGVFGVPEVIRTPDLPLRRRSLYPAELRKHIRPVLYKRTRRLFFRMQFFLRYKI